MIVRFAVALFFVVRYIYAYLDLIGLLSGIAYHLHDIFEYYQASIRCILISSEIIP